ncbi:MAG: VUT family protein [Bacilli bacterium]|nr:VUT family protein [Bacilli bacterium]
MNEKRFSFGDALKRYARETVLLLRAIPSPVVALFVLSVIAMNILASKTLVQTEYLAIDGGILISWLSFLCMDIVTKHFGPRASTKMSIFAIIVNLFTCLIFYVVSIIPSNADDYTKFNEIIGGTWFILLSSTIAFLCSAVINNVTNWLLGKGFKKNPDGKLAFVVRSFVSTFVGQFIDNLIFSILCFMVFAPIFWNGFHWTFVQCVTCSLIGAALELVLEVVFSPIGYAVTKAWKKQGVGEAYFQFQREKQGHVE